LFQIHQNNQSQLQDTNRGIALLVLIALSIVGASWLFSLPVYLDMKIAAQITPVIFSVILFFLVTKFHSTHLNNVAPALGYAVIFCSWSYVIYLDFSVSSSAALNELKQTRVMQYVGMAQIMYLVGLCFISFWLGRYFKYNLYLSSVFIVMFLIMLKLLTNVEVIYLFAFAVLLASTAVFSAISMQSAHIAVTSVPVSEPIAEPIEEEFFLSLDNVEEEIKPELDIDVIPLDESPVSYNWEYILREVHGELKNITDVDLLFQHMLSYIHHVIEFDGAAVGMLQDKSIRKITTHGGDDYFDSKTLNWTNKRIKALFSLGEPILSSQANSGVLADEFADQLHRLDVPVISNQKVVGLITFFREVSLFNTNDVQLISAIVFHSMIALRQARLQDEIKQLGNSVTQVKLTLYNREQFVTQVKPIFEKLSQPRECSLFIIEIDDLDKIIDQQGRDAGAALFRSASKAIMSCLSDKDVLGRYGNDGFIVLLDEINLMHAKSIAEKIRLKIEDMKFSFQNSVLTTTASIGLTIVSNAEEDLPTLIRKADMGLFVAKENGKNTIKVSL